MKKLLILLLTSTFIVACSNNNSEEATNENTKKDEVEEVAEKEEAKVFIQEGPQEISIRSENINISKLSLLSLEYDSEKDELVEREVLKEKENIKEDTKITWEAVYSEGIPSMKLVWELPNGQKDEYIIFYDGKDGLNEEEVMVFPERKDLNEGAGPYISELINFSEEERRAHHENLAEGSEHISDKVYKDLMLPGIHENTESYEGRINPDDKIRFTFPDADRFVDRTSYDPEISEDGYFMINLAEYEFKAGQDILISITKGYPEEQIFTITVNEAQEGMKDIRLRE